MDAKPCRFELFWVRKVWVAALNLLGTNLFAVGKRDVNGAGKLGLDGLET